MICIDSFLIGIFLGFSILQLSEYGIAAIITQMKILKNALCGRMDGPNHKIKSVLQEKEHSGIEVTNATRHFQNIESQPEQMGGNRTYLEEKIEAMRREMGEMKSRLDRYEKLEFHY